LRHMSKRAAIRPAQQHVQACLRGSAA
jgi:hypothetical protein